MKSLASFALSSLTLLAFAPRAHATFLVDPSGGTALSGFNDDDPNAPDPNDGQLSVPLGAAFSFYGASYSSLYVDVDGFLTPSNNGYDFYLDRTVGELADIIPPGVIAPFYDDLYLDPTLGDSIALKSSSAYTAITYAVSGDSDTTAGFESNFQAALITAPTTLQGNALTAGDIVLSYGALDSTVSDSNFSVGVAAGTSNETDAFGVAGGQYATAADFLGNFDPATQALLFRYDAASGTYAQSLITYQAVPEPGTFAALSLAGLALLRRRRR